MQHPIAMRYLVNRIHIQVCLSVIFNTNILEPYHLRVVRTLYVMFIFAICISFENFANRPIYKLAKLISSHISSYSVLATSNILKGIMQKRGNHFYLAFCLCRIALSFSHSKSHLSRH